MDVVSNAIVVRLAMTIAIVSTLVLLCAVVSSDAIVSEAEIAISDIGAFPADSESSEGGDNQPSEELEEDDEPPSESHTASASLASCIDAVAIPLEQTWSLGEEQSDLFRPPAATQV